MFGEDLDALLAGVAHEIRFRWLVMSIAIWTGPEVEASCALAGTCGGFLHRRDELDQRIALGVALCQPDIVVGHRLAVTLLELRGGAVD